MSTNTPTITVTLPAPATDMGTDRPPGTGMGTDTRTPPYRKQLLAMGTVMDMGTDMTITTGCWGS